MASTAATINIALHFTLNGEPVNRYLKVPGQVEEWEPDKGMTVHLHLDARELAKALAPYMAHELAAVIRNATDTRAF